MLKVLNIVLFLLLPFKTPSVVLNPIESIKTFASNKITTYINLAISEAVTKLFVFSCLSIFFQDMTLNVLLLL